MGKQDKGTNADLAEKPKENPEAAGAVQIQPDLSVTDLKEYFKNPRKISKKQKALLRRDLEELGDLGGIVHDLNSGQIIGGNQRTKIMQEDGAEIALERQYDPPTRTGTVAIGHIIYKGEGFSYRQVRWTPKQCEKANIVANKAGGEWDMENMLDQFGVEDLQEYGWEIEELGIKENQDIEEDDVDTTPPEKPQTEIGDLYELDAHRVECGDCTSEDHWKRLMGSDKATLVFTDPPYGVSYASGTNEFEVIKGDHLRDKALKDLLTGAFSNCREYTIEGPALYVFYASRNHIIFEEALNQTGHQVKQQLIWSKGHMLGRSDYHWTHEPIMYARKNEKNSKWQGDRKQRTVLDMTKTDLKQLKKNELVDLLESIRTASTVWEIKKDAGVHYQHPTQKPIKLAARAMFNSSKVGNLVLDPFGGSGSTLIAAEQAKRTARIMELDERYADVIVRRWIQWKIGQGEPFTAKKNGEKLTQEQIKSLIKPGTD